MYLKKIIFILFLVLLSVNQLYPYDENVEDVNGIWKIEASDNNLSGYILLINDKIIIDAYLENSNRCFKIMGTFKTNDTIIPNEVDIVMLYLKTNKTGSVTKTNQILYGIYKLDNEKLTVAIPAPNSKRPVDFKKDWIKLVKIF